MLALFFLGITPVMHYPFDAKTGAPDQVEIVNMLKNAALLGACVMLMTHKSAKAAQTLGGKKNN
jgi:hypothetical protein